MEYLTDKFKELGKKQLVSLRHIVGKQVAWTDQILQPIIGFTDGTFIVFETESREYEVFIADGDDYYVDLIHWADEFKEMGLITEEDVQAEMKARSNTEEQQELKLLQQLMDKHGTKITEKTYQIGPDGTLKPIE